ncbi:Adenosine 3'-phospho 5'-phosphosulfate transporter 1 [Cricetulus griseus]|uniref:Adenosine 3'-phospho 5'-phosphosulfate transporter 1 n=1 Tax=Cricetulus griseus TaxID=10029 RepID=G3IHW4_CRIGR|nr:Adenosine 3'-phospho 5'-phosphosulfate transporter 1 [Cricetulus griseus]
MQTTPSWGTHVLMPVCQMCGAAGANMKHLSLSASTQVLAKMTPVMMMAKLVSRQSYGHCEYLTAGLVSIGVSMFLLSCGPEPRSSPATKLSGLSLLTGYIAFDSFTSNKQDALFAYKMS